MESLNEQQRARYHALSEALQTLQQDLKTGGFDKSACRKALAKFHPDKQTDIDKPVFTLLFQQLQDFIARKGQPRTDDEKSEEYNFDEDRWAADEEEAEEAGEGEEEEEFKSRADFAKKFPDAEELYERELGGSSARRKRPEPAEEGDEKEEKEDEKEREPPVSEWEEQHIAFNNRIKSGKRFNYVYVVVRFPDGSAALGAPQPDQSPAIRKIIQALTVLRVRVVGCCLTTINTHAHRTRAKSKRPWRF